VNAPSRLRTARWAAAAVVLCALSGCFPPPNHADIVFIQKNQKLSQQAADLQRQNDGLKAQLAADEARDGSITPQLPESRLDQLYTTHGLQFTKLTGGFSPDEIGPDQMVKVGVDPIDQDGEALKAAGSFKIELFDLAEPQTRIGVWNFSTEQARDHWYGRVYFYSYVFECPWQTPPLHTDLLVRVTFTDELTGRTFTADRHVTVRL